MKDSKKILSSERLVNFTNERFVSQKTNKKLGKIACCFAFGFLSFWGLFFSTQNNLFAQTFALEYREANGYFPAGYYDEQGVRYELDGDEAVVATGQKVPIEIVNEEGAFWDIVVPAKVSVNGESIERSVTRIAEAAFDEDSCNTNEDSCNILEKIKKSLEMKLRSVDIQAVDLTIIEKNAFRGCCGLTIVKFCGCVKLTVIKSGAFWGCIGLKEVNLNDCVALKIIEDYAFYFCFDLCTANLNCIMLETIGSYVFSECSNLEVVHLGVALKTIKDHAFYRCYKLKVLNWDACIALEIIENNAFACSGLESVKIPANVREIEDEAFRDSKLRIVEISANVEDIGAMAFHGCLLSEVNVVEDGDGNYVAFDNVLFEINKYNRTAKVRLFPQKHMENDGQVTTSYVVPEKVFKNGIEYSVIAIGKWAICNCEYLMSLDIPECVKTLEWCAICNCAVLKRVSLPMLEVVEAYVLSDCDALELVFVKGDWNSPRDYKHLPCFKVILKDGDGNIVATQIVFLTFNEGWRAFEKPEKAVDPAEFGMKETQWFKDDGQEFDFDTRVTEGMVLHAVGAVE